MLRRGVNQRQFPLVRHRLRRGYPAPLLFSLYEGHGELSVGRFREKPASTIIIRTSHVRSFATNRIGSESASWITDESGSLTELDKNALSDIIREVRSKFGVELAVLIEQDYPGAGSVRERAVQVFNAWGIGSRELNNGILIYMCLNRRRVEVIVGTGLDATFPEGLITEALENRVIPTIKKHGKGPGLVEAAELCKDALMGKEFHENESSSLLRRIPNPLRRPSSSSNNEIDRSLGDQKSGGHSYEYRHSGLAFALFFLFVGGALHVAKKDDTEVSRKCEKCGNERAELLDTLISDEELNLCNRTERKLRSAKFVKRHCQVCGDLCIVRKELIAHNISRCRFCSCRTMVLGTPVIMEGALNNGDKIEVIEGKCAMCNKTDETRRIRPGPATRALEFERSSSSGNGRHGGGFSTGSGGGGASF